MSSNIIHDTVLRLVRGKVDLTPRQISILFVLGEHSPGERLLSLGEIADKTKLSRPLVSRSVSRLMQAEYVACDQDPTDHRLVLPRLTAAGKAFMKALVKGGMDQLIGRLADGDMDITLRQLFVLFACVARTRTVRWLAAEMRIVKPAVTRAVDRLADENYVKRMPDGEDRRSILIGIRPRGLDFVRSMTAE
jgi:DNA-binding MarR family transcriptional regulator